MFTQYTPELALHFDVVLEDSKKGKLIKMFSRKPKDSKASSHVIDVVGIPGWEDIRYATLAREFSQSAGLSEDWNVCLAEAQPENVLNCLQKVPIEKHKELASVARRGWVLLSAYRKMHERCLQLEREHRDMETQLVEARNASTMLACQNKLLQDKYEVYNPVAEKAAVRVAQYKYRKRRGKVNARKVHSAIAKAGANWDPDLWDANIWDTSDFSSGSEREGCQDRSQNEKEPLRVVRAQPIYRHRLQQLPNQPGAPDVMEPLEDYTKEELSDITSRFQQRLGVGKVD